MNDIQLTPLPEPTPRNRLGMSGNDVEYHKRCAAWIDTNLADLAALVATIPTDKASAEYALWMLAQGKKIRQPRWTPGNYLTIRDGGVLGNERDEICFRFVPTGHEWVEFAEAPPTDDAELGRKRAEFNRKILEIARAVVKMYGFSASKEVERVTTAIAALNPSELVALDMGE